MAVTGADMPTIIGTITASTYPEALQLANAVGQDAGNRSMRRAGRTAWSEQDWHIAADTTRRALAAAGFGAGSLMRASA
jgi:hypothetical protein